MQCWHATWAVYSATQCPHIALIVPLCSCLQYAYLQSVYTYLHSVSTYLQNISTLCIYISTLCTQHGYKPPYCWTTQRCRVLRQTSCRLSVKYRALLILQCWLWMDGTRGQMLPCSTVTYIPIFRHISIHFNTSPHPPPRTIPPHGHGCVK